MSSFEFRHRASIPPTILNLWLNNHFSELELKLMCIMDAYDCEKSKCFMSNKTLGSLLGVTPRRIQQALAKLKTQGHIIFQYNEKTQARIIETQWKDIRYWDKHKGGGDETLLHPPHEAPLHPNILSKDNTKEGEGVSATRCTPGSLGFVDEERKVSQKEKTRSAQDEKIDVLANGWSLSLREHLCINPNVTKRPEWSYKIQVKHFKSLARSETLSLLQIDQILEWYFDAMKRPGFRPQAVRPELVTKDATWQWIKDLYNAEKQANKPAIPKAEMQCFAKSLAIERIKALTETVEEELELDWPAKALSQLMDFVKFTTFHYLRFLKWCNDDNAATIMDCWDHLPNMERFIIMWCQIAKRKVKGWNEWKGDLSKLSLEIDGETFRSLLREWTGASRLEIEQITSHYVVDKKWSPINAD